MFQVCGPLRRWRRVRDTQGAPKAFGFCEYQTADAVLRALRVLGGGDDSTQALELPDPTGQGVTRRLVVKADDATRSSLDEYEKARPKTEVRHRFVACIIPTHPARLLNTSGLSRQIWSKIRLRVQRPWM